MESDGAVVHQLDTLRPLTQHLAPGTAIVLVAPFHIGRRDRCAVVEFGARAQPERRALRVLGEVETFGERRMIVQLVAEVLDQPVMQRHQEIVGRRRAVVMLRIEPARCDVGVPGQRQPALRRDVRRARCAPRGHDPGQRRGAAREHAASARCADTASRSDPNSCLPAALSPPLAIVDARRPPAGADDISTSAPARPRRNPVACCHSGSGHPWRRVPKAARWSPPLECDANIAEIRAAGNSNAG